MSTGDNLLKSGWTGLEHLNEPGRKNALDADQGHLYHRVEIDRSDEYDSYTLTVTTQPILIAEADAFRTTLKIRNLSGPNVVVGKATKVHVRAGYLLLAGNDLDVKTTGAVWIGPEAAGNSGVTYVSVWLERDNEVN